MTQVLEVSNVNFHFAETKVLEDVHFTINKNDFVGLVGSNGAGKSTLLRLILGELRPIRGEIKMFGTSMNQFQEWNRVGYIAQKNADLNSDFPATVLEVVVANLYRSIGWGRPIRQIHREKAMAALKLTAVDHLASRRIGELSGGQQQRVFLARALVNDPEFLILDEATSGIDERSEGVFYDLLDHLRAEKNMTILMVSHDLAAVTAHSNRMFCLGVDGFFEHPLASAIDQDFFQKLYGYAVNVHVHQHDCADHAGMASVETIEAWEQVNATDVHSHQDSLGKERRTK